MNSAVSRRPGGMFARVVGVAALLVTGLFMAGCGLGPGEETGDAGLLVTRDYGSHVLVDDPEMPVNESSTAMRLLDEQSKVETEYGGEYVQSVDGLSGKISGGRSYDWFFSVNGVVAERGSAQFPIGAVDLVWWDYRDWTDAMEIGAQVGAYPAPFSTGYDGRDWGVEIDCLGAEVACGMVENQLQGDGVALEKKNSNMVIRVGDWNEALETPEGRRILRGPGSSGVFVRFGTTPVSQPLEERDPVWDLIGLDAKGDDAQAYGPEAGLVAAMRRADDPPVWLVTGGTDDAVRMAAAALNPEDLERRYAAVVSDGRVSSLPLP